MGKRAIRLISIAAALSIIGGMFAGCQKKQDQGDSSNTQAKGPKSTLTVEVFDRGASGQPSLNDNYWTKYINSNFGEKYNADVQFIPVPRTQEVSKLNVLMAANEAPDICISYDVGLVNNYVNQGGLTQLDDILAKDGKNLSKYLGDEVLKYGKFGGKQFVIPAKRTLRMTTNLFMRKDWLDKLGLPLPTTREEFYNDLVAFRDKNPGGVSGVIPMGYSIGTGSNISVHNLPESFYKKASEQDLAATTFTLTAEMEWKKDGYKDFTKFMNKLYHENLISKDFAVDKTASQLNADLTKGKVGAVAANWDYIYRPTPGIYANLKKNVPGAELVPVDAFKNSEGKYAKKNYPPSGAYIMVPKSSENASLAIKYLDWMSDTKVIMALQNGEEGTDYTLSDGIPTPKSPSTLTGDKFLSTSYNGDYCILVNGPELGDQEKNTKAISAAYPDFKKDVDQAQKIGLTDGYTGFYFSIPNAAYGKYSQTLTDKTLLMKAKLYTCDPSQFDSLYDSEVAEYMAAGGQAVYDENVKNYKTQTGK